ncbi:MAG: alpha/beta hydrolase [Planctomycetaceae bacterium]|nr:alpha/beta hydrolase [Planctomycetaceae bacterium]
MFIERRLTGEEFDLNYASGSAGGTPLIMLHGVTRRWQSFVPVLGDLSMRWHPFALDFRGHGKSANTTAGYLVNDYVADAVRLLEQFDEPVVLYGHSLGSMVAAAVAQQYPDHVRAIILEDPPMQAMGQEISQSVLHSFFRNMQQFTEDQRSVGAIAKDLAEIRLQDPQTGNETRLGDVRDAASLRFTASCLQKLDSNVLFPIIQGRWMEGYDAESVFRGIRCPALLLQADISAGGMLCDEDAAMIESLVSDLTRIKFLQTGHLIHWGQTQKLINLITAFLETV